MAQEFSIADKSFIRDIPIELTVELGRTTLTVRQLANLSKDDVIELDRHASQPLNIRAGERIFARGEVVVMDDRVALRMTELVGQAAVTDEEAS